jgi:uncharacterized SAM-binding protein YcdF (DUF218 family)
MHANSRHSRFPLRRIVAAACRAVPPAIALFLGGFSLLNLAGGLAVPGFDATLWWLDLRPLPAGLAQPVLAAASLLLAAYGLAPSPGVWRRRLTAGAAFVLLGVALGNAAGFARLLLRGGLHAGFPLPFSLLVAAALAAVLAALRRPVPERGGVAPRLAVGAAFLACLAAFPLAQMACFGKTDYRRPADAIVVFGARAYADGSPSQALADRVQTACRLHRQGLAARLVFSGGPADGDMHETEAMRRMALRLGVPDEAIVLDREGLNTRATVRNTVPLFERLGVRRVLAVSHAYHLPRVKLAYQRAGWEVYTVPAEETYVLTAMPYLMAREVAALWVYYLRPLAG